MDLTNQTAVDNLLKLMLLAIPSAGFLTLIVYLFLRQLGKQSGNASGLTSAISDLSDNFGKLLTSMEATNSRNGQLQNNIEPVVIKISEVISRMADAQTKHDTQIELIARTQQINADSTHNLAESTKLGNEALKSIAESNKHIDDKTVTMVKLQEEGNLNLTTYSNDITDAVATQSRVLLENLSGLVAGVNNNINDQAQRTNEFIATIPDKTVGHDEFQALSAHLNQASIGIEEFKTATSAIHKIAIANREDLQALKQLLADWTARVEKAMSTPLGIDSGQSTLS